ncbi:modulator of macroautophagy TMEM150B isoform X2 [Erythrolamprus reginae]|uniref:modulator of macroautophagy TMEM150B isoform X2 n=1 Tax=Erythrolamprus reginae TaxID=121349 RepID=UPI00396C4369
MLVGILCAANLALTQEDLGRGSLSFSQSPRNRRVTKCVPPPFYLDQPSMCCCKSSFLNSRFLHSFKKKSLASCALSPCGFGLCFLCSWLQWGLLASGLCSHFFRFGMAITNGSVNVTDTFPYISTCGAYPPQSCVFGQILNLGAFLGMVICFLRYQQIRDYGCHSRLNLLGLILGLLCAFGASLVGNFQQYNQLEVHVIGAFLAFVIGNLYFWVQSFLTNRVRPRHGGNWIGPLRFVLTICGSILFISTVALFYLHLHSEAAYCEWAMAMVLFLLFGLFAVDFKHIGGCSIHVKPRGTDDNFPSVQISIQTVSL